MANIKNFGLVGVGSDVQFGKSGPRLKNDTGTFKFRNAGDTGFAAIVADSLTADSLKGNAEQIVKLDAAGKLVLGGALSDLATDSELSAAIATEVTNRNTAISTAISQEVSDRNSAISAAVSPVQTEVDAIETAVGLNSNGTMTALAGNNYANGTTVLGALTAMDGAVKTAIDGKLSLSGGTMTGALILDADPTANLGAATKQYVDGKISALGNAFEYVGTIALAGASSGAAYDLSVLTKKDPGDYYKVITASGWFKVGSGGTPFYANVGDGLVWNTSSGVDIVDNTNSQVQGTTNFITVTGTADTGFTVDVASNFKGRVDTLESSSSALQTEVNAIETSLGSAVAANGTFAGFSSTNYLNAATSMTDADVKLDTALKALSDTVSGMSLSFTVAGNTGSDSFSTGKTLTFTGTSGDIVTSEASSSGNSTVTFSLATTGVTAVGTAKIQKITVDTKGRILTSADVSTTDLTEGSNLYFTDARARAALSVTGTGLAYNSTTGVISSNGTDANTASTLVARDASGNFAAGGVTVTSLTDSGLTAGRLVFAGAAGLLTDDSALTFNAGTDTLTVTNLVATGTVTVPTPTAGTDAANKSYVDTAIGTAAVNTAHGKYVAFTAGGTATSVSLGTITGRVHRVKVFIDTADTNSTEVQVGTDGTNNDLVTTADVDTSVTGVYILEVNKVYSATELKVFVDAGSTVGAVLIEYL